MSTCFGFLIIPMHGKALWSKTSLPIKSKSHQGNNPTCSFMGEIKETTSEEKDWGKNRLITQSMSTSPQVEVCGIWDWIICIFWQTIRLWNHTLSILGSTCWMWCVMALIYPLVSYWRPLFLLMKWSNLHAFWGVAFTFHFCIEALIFLSFYFFLWKF